MADDRYSSRNNDDYGESRSNYSRRSRDGEELSAEEMAYRRAQRRAAQQRRAQERAANAGDQPRQRTRSSEQGQQRTVARNAQGRVDGNQYRRRPQAARPSATLPSQDARARAERSRQYRSERQGAQQQPSFQDEGRRGRGAAGSYNSSGFYAAPKRNKLPFIIGGLLVVILIAAVAFGIHSCNASKSDSSDGASTTSTQTASGTTAAEEGRIVMTLGGDEDTLVLKGEDYIESGCHAVDKQEGNITDSVQIDSSEVDTSKAGDYTVTYTAQNSEKMVATKTRTVHVVEEMDADIDGISVMMYHYVYADDDPPESTDTNYISASKFEQELQYLVENDFYFPSYQELAAYIEGVHSLPQKSIILTFDDGERGFLENGIPLLEKYKVPATSFIICIDDDASERIIEFASEYVTFQSHTYGLHTGGSHPEIGGGGRIYDLSESELVEDTKKAQEILGTTEAVAYPFGDYSDVAPAAMESAGVLCAFTTHYGQVHIGDNPYTLSRMRVFGDGDVSGFYYQTAHEG